MSNEALEKQRQAMVADLEKTIAKFEALLANPPDPKITKAPIAVANLIADLEKVIPELREMLAKWQAKNYSGGKTRRRRRGPKRRTRRTR